LKIVACALVVIALLTVRTVLRERFRDPSTSGDSSGPSGCIVMVSSTTREEARFLFVVGTIRNNCSYRVSHITVAFKGDSSDSPAYAHPDDLQPGETRTFRSSMPVPRDELYHFDKISAF
jgi:hypothetical protein